MIRPPKTGKRLRKKPEIGRERTSDLMTQEKNLTFPAIRERLSAIAEEVGAEGISLDDALSLYDEAVKLALQACDLAEDDLLENDEGGSAAVDEGAPADDGSPDEEQTETNRSDL